MQTSLKNKQAPLPQPSKNLQGEQIHMSSLDMAHRKCSKTLKEKFQDKWTL